jgi:hypothetical protein
VLFAPPNVKGWRTGTDWLNSATLLARNNFAETVAMGSWNFTPPQPVRPGRPVNFAKPTAPGEASGPNEHVDPIVTIYATHPKTPAEVLNRISDLLFGDRIAAAKLAKIEKYLKEPIVPGAPASKPKSDGKPGPKTANKPTTPENTPAVEAVLEAQPTKEAAKEPPKDAKNAAPPGVDSKEFKARVREALHAMMCLPEYQTN